MHKPPSREAACLLVVAAAAAARLGLEAHVAAITRTGCSSCSSPAGPEAATAVATSKKAAAAIAGAKQTLEVSSGIQQ